MTVSTVSERIPQRWYGRPVFFVSDVQGALRFYIDKPTQKRGGATT